MPEVRVETVYDSQGNIVNQIPYEVSDEELEREQAEKAIVELSALADEVITMPQITKFVQALARLRR